jgi:hypothetical protein
VGFPDGGADTEVVGLDVVGGPDVVVVEVLVGGGGGAQATAVPDTTMRAMATTARAFFGPVGSGLVGRVTLVSRTAVRFRCQPGPEDGSSREPTALG